MFFHIFLVLSFQRYLNFSNRWIMVIQLKRCALIALLISLDLLSK